MKQVISLFLCSLLVSCDIRTVEKPSELRILEYFAESGIEIPTDSELMHYEKLERDFLSRGWIYRVDESFDLSIFAKQNNFNIHTNLWIADSIVKVINPKLEENEKLGKIKKLYTMMWKGKESETWTADLVVDDNNRYLYVSYLDQRRDYIPPKSALSK